MTWGFVCRVCEELSIIDPVDTYTPEMPPNLSNEVEQPHYTQEIKVNHNFEGISPAMPPSFQSLLANCCPEVKKGRFPIPPIDSNISYDLIW